jgi:hypothetical protein
MTDGKCYFLPKEPDRKALADIDEISQKIAEAVSEGKQVCISIEDKKI